MQEKHDTERQLNWGNILFLALSPIVAIFGTLAYEIHYGFHWSDVLIFLIFYVLTAGMGISAGYHRHFAHRSYECHSVLEFFYLVCGAASLQNSALRWSRDHRIHHQHIDQDDDPYNIQKGVFHAHMGWIFYKSEHDDDFSGVPDLLKNRWVVWQDRHYLAIAIFVGFVLPTLIGWAFGRPMAGLLWGGFVRTVVVHHLTFFINSLAHKFGKRPFTEAFSARDSWWLAFLTYGEGYHNFHHRFASDYRNGYRWYHWDPTKWWVNVMSWVGMVGRVRRYQKEQLIKARIETDFERARHQLAAIPSQIAAKMEGRLNAARTKVEACAARWEKAKLQFAQSSKESRDLWKLRLRKYKFQFEASQAQWAFLIAAVTRFFHHHSSS
ncbi:MAG TPA: fatty acid desaturase [bacterium]|nr:fatty acid desaturase [bacterium]